MKRTVMSLALVTCLALLALTATGCQMIAQKATESAIQGATGGAVNVKGDSVTIKDKDGAEATISNETKIPAGFPSEVPLRDDGNVKAVITSQASGGGTSYMVSIQFKVPQSEVLDWYKTELEKGGWTIGSTVNTGDGGMVSAEKGDLTLNVVTGSENSDGYTSVVTMQVGPKSK